MKNRQLGRNIRAAPGRQARRVMAIGKRAIAAAASAPPALGAKAWREAALKYQACGGVRGALARGSQGEGKRLAAPSPLIIFLALTGIGIGSSDRDRRYIEWAHLHYGECEKPSANGACEKYPHRSQRVLLSRAACR